MIRHACRMLLIAALAAAMPLETLAQDTPFREDGWAKLPDGRKWGATSAVTIDRDGSSVWVFERCGAGSCAGSNVAPIVKLDSSGKYLKSFGAGMFVQPHGIHVDRDGNVWVTDAQGKDGKGHVVVKFNPDGKVLMTLGKLGVAGNGPDTFNQPSSVTTAPNGDIYVGDGHGGESNARIVQFTKDGKFIRTWGKKGAAPGEFGLPHAIAVDSSGRVFVGDRPNSRIQIFDADGKFLEEWKQFGRPSGIYIDANDTLYVADHQSDEKVNPGFKRGVRIGSVKDGVVKGFIPGFGTNPATFIVGEGVAADAQGNVYWAETSAGMTVRKFVRK
jgi:sugar lactone lactonase YvrE